MSNISKIIREHNLSTGSAMRDIYGQDIEGSVVLGSYTVLLRSAVLGYALRQENPINGDETVIHLTPADMLAMKVFLSQSI